MQLTLRRPFTTRDLGRVLAVLPAHVKVSCLARLDGVHVQRSGPRRNLGVAGADAKRCFAEGLALHADRSLRAFVAGGGRREDFWAAQDTWLVPVPMPLPGNALVLHDDDQRLHTEALPENDSAMSRSTLAERARRDAARRNLHLKRKFGFGSGVGLGPGLGENAPPLNQAHAQAPPDAAAKRRSREATKTKRQRRPDPPTPADAPSLTSTPTSTCPAPGASSSSCSSSNAGAPRRFEGLQGLQGLPKALLATVKARGAMEARMAPAAQRQRQTRQFRATLPSFFDMVYLHFRSGRRTRCCLEDLVGSLADKRGGGSNLAGAARVRMVREQLRMLLELLPEWCRLADSAVEPGRKLFCVDNSKPSRVSAWRERTRVQTMNSA